MALCKKDRRRLPKFDSLPVVQGGRGRHGCAYDKGIQDGLLLKEKNDVRLHRPNESQVGTVLNKSRYTAHPKVILMACEKRMAAR